LDGIYNITGKSSSFENIDLRDKETMVQSFSIDTMM
jgi:hypothetical protein